MPGKGAARSRSSPRERPSSAANASPNPFAFTKSSFGGPSGGSPRVGTPTGPRKVTALNLSSSNLNSGSPRCSPYHSPECSARLNNGAEKCICGICTCGQHKCPTQQKTNIFYGGDSSFDTTHSDAFVNHDTRHYATKATKGPQVYVPGERFEALTTHQEDFLWHERERPSSALRSNSRMGMERSTPFHHSAPEIKMDLSTTYGAQFVEHSIPTKSAKPAQATYTYGSPREFRTTKQVDYNGVQPSRCPASVLPSRLPSARTGHVKYNMDLTGTWR